MRIAILGATSQIAKDLVLSFTEQDNHELVLYARRTAVVATWLEVVGLSDRYPAYDFDRFTVEEQFDAILNFVGVGNPAQAAAMGAAIFDVTLKYDEMALDYVHQRPGCRYVFLSSGAAYGSSFEAPADSDTKAVIAINHLQPQDWYGVSKLYAECRHRALPHLPIVDVRIFNYFSHTQDASARFLITDILRAIRDKTVLQTSGSYIVRDFLHHSDFHQLILSVLAAPATNVVLDAYSRAPVDKVSLLRAMQVEFGLNYEIVTNASINATGEKPFYYSVDRRAAEFGFKPAYSSIAGVLKEVRIALAKVIS